MKALRFSRPALAVLALALIATPPASASESLFGSFTDWLRDVTTTLGRPFHKKEQPKPTSPAPAPVTPTSEDETDEYAVVRPKVSDPFEKFNRSMFRFNDGFYTYILRPVSKGYTKVTPRPVRTGLTNFFDNIRFPIRFAGALLQGKVGRATKETGKFLVNTTAGFAGFIRVSNDIPQLADVPPEDVGQAFGRWGVKPGPFLVLPILGPTSTRDLVGRTGDFFLTPTNWHWMESYDWRLRTGVAVTDTVNSLPHILQTYDDMKASALDPYLSVRDGYISYREAQVKK